MPSFVATTTPTNHTTHAFFGGLEAEPSDSDEEDNEDVESSGDEQSSIDCSQLIDPSVHTRTTRTTRTTLPGGDHTTHVLPPVIEEGNVHGGKAVTATATATAGSNSQESSPPLPPLEHPLSNHEPSTRPTIQTTGSSSSPTLTTDTPLAREQQEPPSPAPGFLSSVPSGMTTMHVSNVDAIAYQRMEEESERNVAWAIHAVLGVFCALVIVASVMTFFIVEKYGLVVLVGSMVMVSFAIFLMWFVDQTVLSHNPRLKPMRQKIIRVVELAKKAMVEEFQLFKRDWNEHFLLTNGRASSMDDDDEEDNNIDDDDEERRSTTTPRRNGRRGTTTTAQPPQARRRKKRRSVVFGALKSSFQMGRRIWGRKQARATHHTNHHHSSSNTTATQQQEPKYHPPNADNGVIA